MYRCRRAAQCVNAGFAVLSSRQPAERAAPRNRAGIVAKPILCHRLETFADKLPVHGFRNVVIMSPVIAAKLVYRTINSAGEVILTG